MNLKLTEVLHRAFRITQGWMLLCCLSQPHWSRSRTDVTQGRLHLGHFLYFLVQAEKYREKYYSQKISVALIPAQQ